MSAAVAAAGILLLLVCVLLLAAVSKALSDLQRIAVSHGIRGMVPITLKLRLIIWSAIIGATSGCGLTVLALLGR
jgi:hypothetical protein